MSIALSALSTLAAAVPAGVVCSNLREYRPLPEPLSRRLPSVSVLIPARNEQANIRAAVESVLRCEGLELEVLVLDDGSTDQTAEIVQSIAERDPRLKLIEGTPPPSGWAGKPFACQTLADAAKGDVLVFIDADVRLRGGDSLARVASAFLRDELALLSGVPWQRMETLSELLIVPLIHFVLLGYLPLARMRGSTHPRFAAACGQFMAFRRSTYHSTGGHSKVRASFHEGIGLSRTFREAGHITDLFDAKDVAACRMYDGFGAVWNGFAKNAHEGLASSKAVVPMSLLLFFGQVWPFFYLLSGVPNRTEAAWAFAALLLSLVTRCMLAHRCRQPWTGVLMHPFGVGLLLLNQWYGALRFWFGKPVGWRGRSVAVIAFFLLLAGSGLSAEPSHFPEISLEDQHGVVHKIDFPRDRPLYVVASAKEGSKHIKNWVKPIAERFREKVDILGLADLRAVPGPLHGIARAFIRSGTQWPVLLDWNGVVSEKIPGSPSHVDVLLVSSTGSLQLHLHGIASPDSISKVSAEIETLLAKAPRPSGKTSK